MHRSRAGDTLRRLQEDVTGMHTQIGIVGAGPAGLLLSHLLHLNGIDSVVLEARSRDYVENRIRAGVLEYPVEQLLIESGVGERMQAEGLPHEGVNLRVGGLDQERDWPNALSEGEIVFEAENVSVHDVQSDAPHILYEHGGTHHRLDCDFIAGCDGYHGICRDAIPAGVLRVFERDYPFGWLGILADAPPASEELVYASHARGFALLSMRSPSVSRLYLQCAPDEDIEAWSDDRIWSELQTRLARDGFSLTEGPITQKGVTQMRSFVVEPMQCGRLFLLGDAAHIVPPTGAKGLNLAAADVAVLTQALVAYVRRGETAGLDRYSETALRRVWKAQRFSWWMTSLLHRFAGHTPFEQRVQRAELDFLFESRAASTALAENYVGLPLVL